MSVQYVMPVLKVLTYITHWVVWKDDGMGSSRIWLLYEDLITHGVICVLSCITSPRSTVSHRLMHLGVCFFRVFSNGIQLCSMESRNTALVDKDYWTTSNFDSCGLFSVFVIVKITREIFNKSVSGFSLGNLIFLPPCIHLVTMLLPSAQKRNFI